MCSSEYHSCALQGASENTVNSSSHHSVSCYPYGFFLICSILHKTYFVYVFCLEPRRAAVAIIVRVTPSPLNKWRAPDSPQPPSSLPEFFNLDWVNESGARAEILFLRREQPSDKTVAQHKPRHAEDAHVAFPGGRTEEGDEGGLYTGRFPMHSKFLHH